MDYAALMAQLGARLPFNKLLDIRTVNIDDGSAEAAMAYRKELTNHLGTLHATAIYGLSEAASGYAVSGTLLPLIRRVRAVATSSTIAYHRFAKTAVKAKARTAIPSDAIRSTLTADGKADVLVEVEISDDHGMQIATSTFSWTITLRSSA